MVMDIGLVVIIVIVALFVGILLGFLFSKATSKDSSGNIKNQMDSLQERFNDYQSEVATHFNTTASLAQKISQDYQDMQAHLANSVETLIADEELRIRLLAEIKTDTAPALDYSVEATVVTPATTHNEAPKDYAPKTPGEIGTLDEEFAVKHK